MMGPEKPAQIICHLLELLKDSRRLPVPPGCPMEVRSPPPSTVGCRPSPYPLTAPFCLQVYAMMLSCWAFTPSARPTFTELAARVEALRDGRGTARG